MYVYIYIYTICAYFWAYSTWIGPALGCLEPQRIMHQTKRAHHVLDDTEGLRHPEGQVVTLVWPEPAPDVNQEYSREVVAKLGRSRNLDPTSTQSRNIEKEAKKAIILHTRARKGLIQGLGNFLILPSSNAFVVSGVWPCLNVRLFRVNQFRQFPGYQAAALRDPSDGHSKSKALNRPK